MRKAILLFIIVLSLTACSTKAPKEPSKDADVNITDTIKGQDAIEKVDGKEVQTKLFSAPIEDSYYLEQLPAYTDDSVSHIKNSILNFEKEVRLPRSLPIKEAKRIMNIMFLDEPNLFHLNHQVNFELDDAGDVRVIQFSYNMEKDEYDNFEEKLIRKYGIKPRLQEVNNYDLVKEILEKSVNDDPNYCHENTLDDRSCLNSFNHARVRVMALREAGIESLIVFGENVSDKYKDEGVFLKEFKDATIKEKTKDNVTTYSVDVSDMYAWVMVRLNNSYYHYDPLYNAVSTKQLNKKINTVFKGMSLVSDSVSSRYLSSYYTESLLGVIPEADSHQFTASFRDNTFVESMSSANMQKYIQDLVKNDFTPNKNFKAQFEDEGNYNQFVSSIDHYVSLYNQENLPIITNYNLEVFPEALQIYIYGVKK